MTTQTPQSFSTSGAGSDPTLTGSEGGASVRERAGQVGGTAKDEAAGVAQEVKYQARDLVGEARSQVRQQVDTQKGRVSDLLREISDELEQMAERSDRNGLASDLVRQVAVRARDARGYLDGGGDFVEDVRRFARRRPGTFLLGALAAGVLAGRATRAAAAARRAGGETQPRSAYAGTNAPSSAGYAGQYAGYPPQSAPGTYSGTTGYETTGTASAAPASGYGTAPTGTSYGTTTAYGTTAAGAGHQTTPGGTEYDEQTSATYDPTTGYATSNPAGSQPGYVAPGETTPPDREERA